MLPQSPVIPGYSGEEVVWAKDQPEYKPLPALVTKRGVTVSRWSLTPEERKAVAAGEDLYLIVWTFGLALQPVMMQIPTGPQEIADIASLAGATLAAPER